eukprot:12939066-Prorocentrum_lima.AAC.1
MVPPVNPVKNWFFAMDSIGKTAGTGSRRWYRKEVEENMGVGFSFYFEMVMGAGFRRLAEMSSSNSSSVNHADAVW